MSAMANFHGRAGMETGTMKRLRLLLAAVAALGCAVSFTAFAREEGATFVGAHHFGFQVEDLAEAEKRIEENGGKFFFDLGDERHGNFERKFKDPDGVIFDISKHGWQGTVGYKK